GNTSLRECEILKSRREKDNTYSYYIHFTNYNPRLDNWYPGSELK
ncbi:hypothetical protein KIPB_016966, partial [Kipferlia bialata]